MAVPRALAQRCLRFTSTATQSNAKEKWDLFSAVCLERKPVITRGLLPVEAKVHSLAQELEYELSLKSDHEVKMDKDRERQIRLKQGELDENELDQTTLVSAQDFEDASAEELSKFTFAGRMTEADQKKDRKSLERILDRHLLLVVQQKLGGSQHWILPQGMRRDGETMRQTAERVLAETCGTEIKARFIGNAPCGFYKYKYPNLIRGKDGNGIGAKVFFFKAHLLNEKAIQKGSVIADFAWLGRDELSELLPGTYKKSVCEFLIDED